MGKDFLCAAEAGSDSISVYSLKTGTRECTYQLKNASKPHHLTVSGKKIYHTDCFSGTVGFVDSSSGKQRAVSVGAYPTSALVLENGLFITCGEANSVWLLDADTLAAKNCADTACFPICAANFGDGAVTAALFGCALEFFDGSISLVCTHKLARMPLCASSDNDAVYACCCAPEYGGELLLIVDGEAVSIKTLLTGAVKPLEGGLLALLHVWDDSVTIFDTNTLSPVKTVKTARMPDDAVYIDGKLYISCIQSNSVQCFDLNGDLICEFATLREPRGLALL